MKINEKDIKNFFREAYDIIREDIEACEFNIGNLGFTLVVSGFSVGIGVISRRTDILIMSLVLMVTGYFMILGYTTRKKRLEVYKVETVTYKEESPKQ